MDRSALVTERLNANLAAAVERVAARLEWEKGPFVLLMLIPVDPSFPHSRYDLLASAPWLDPMSPYDAIVFLTEQVVAELGSRRAPEYARLDGIRPRRTIDRFVVAATFRLREYVGRRVPRLLVAGEEVDDSIVLRAVPPDEIEGAPAAPVAAEAAVEEEEPKPARKRKRAA